MTASEAVLKRADRFEIINPCCGNCEDGNHETDGDYGEIDCGWTCMLRQEETTPEHCCNDWTPGFWQSKFARDVDCGDSWKETQASIVEAVGKYKSELRSEPDYVF